MKATIMDLKEESIHCSVLQCGGGVKFSLRPKDINRNIMSFIQSSATGTSILEVRTPQFVLYIRRELNLKF